ncbi:MAG: hypothetical protein PHU14_05745 [Methylovulum sp.]|nr:hypothetical protein [Methylovulum sp.]
MPKRSVQPQQLVGINPLYAQDVLCLWNAATPDVNIKTGKRGYNTGTGISDSISAKGRAKTFIGAAGTGKYPFTTAPEGNAITLLWVGNSISAINAGVAPRPISFYNGASGRYDLYLGGSGTNLNFEAERDVKATWRNTSPVWFASGVHIFAVTYDGNTVSNAPKFFADGIAQPVTQIIAPSGNLVSPSGLCTIGGRPDITTRQFLGSLLMAAALNRALSDSEIYQLSKNPWQLFAAPPKRIWSPAPTPTVLAGDAQATITASGQLTQALALSGKAKAAVSANADLNQTTDLSGDATANTSGTGDLATATDLSGDALAQATAIGVIRQDLSLSGLAAASISADGVLNQALPLQGNAVSATLADGTVTVNLALKGAALSAVVGDAFLAQTLSLAGDAHTSAGATGDLTRLDYLSGSAQTDSAASAVLNLTATLSGLALVQMLADGDLGGLMALAGAGRSRSQGAAGLSASIALAGAATASTTANADLVVICPLLGAAATVAAGSADVTLGVSLSAQALAQVLASGDLTIALPLSGAALANCLANARLLLSNDYVIPSGLKTLKDTTPPTLIKTLNVRRTMNNLTPPTLIRMH